VRIRDLDSLNGTVLDGVGIIEALLRLGSLVRLGKTVIRFEPGTEMNHVPLSEDTRFGSLTSVSLPMRAAFAMLTRAAQSDATVLLEGETGTGKSQAALSVHRKSARPCSSVGHARPPAIARGACAAYQLVIARWSAASTTSREAQLRAMTLGCTSAPLPG